VRHIAWLLLSTQISPVRGKQRVALVPQRVRPVSGPTLGQQQQQQPSSLSPSLLLLMVMMLQKELVRPYCCRWGGSPSTRRVGLDLIFLSLHFRFRVGVDGHRRVRVASVASRLDLLQQRRFARPGYSLLVLVQILRMKCIDRR
jgi:hypothetical protein